MAQRKSKSGTKNSITVHLEIPLDIHASVKNLAEKTDRSVRKMMLACVKDALPRLLKLQASLEKR